MLKIKARCVEMMKAPAFTNKGVFLPCCWCDSQNLQDWKDLGFFNQEFHISNLQTSEDVRGVFGSETWQDFYQMLYIDPASAPEVCRRKCGDTGDYNSTKRIQR